MGSYRTVLMSNDKRNMNFRIHNYTYYSIFVDVCCSEVIILYYTNRILLANKFYIGF